MTEVRSIAGLEVAELGPQFRTFSLDLSGIDKEKRTVPLVFSSTEPIERWGAFEVLDHSKGSVRLGRLQNGAALLWNHRIDDHLGAVEDVWIEKDKQGRAVVRFGKSARAEEKFQDVIDGILHAVSVGYFIHRMVLKEAVDDGMNTYIAVDWEPFEISMVTVAADITVGVGRTPDLPAIRERTFQTVQTRIQQGTAPAPAPAPAPKPEEGNRIMPPEDPTPVPTPAPVIAPEEAQRQRAQITREARETETTRIREIEAAGARFQLQEFARKHIQDGTSLADFRELLIAEIGEPAPTRTQHIGMDEDEIKRFSVLRLLHWMDDPKDAARARMADLEIQTTRAAAEKSGSRHGGVVMPADVFYGATPHRKRTLVTGTAASAGDLVADDFREGDFISLLREATPLGAVVSILDDLKGPVFIPRQTASITPYNLAEDAQLTLDDLEVDLVSMSPTTAAGGTSWSRRMELQSSLGLEQLARMDILESVMTKVWNNLINGDGTGNTPVGVRNQTGIGDVADAGGNGSAPDWEDLIDIQTLPAVGNAMFARPGWLLNSRTVGYLRKTTKVAGYPVYLMDRRGELAGDPVMMTNAVPSNLTVGTGTNLSALIYSSNWRSMLVGFWGALELLFDPYTDADRGRRNLRAFIDYDGTVRHPEEFAAKQDADCN